MRELAIATLLSGCLAEPATEESRGEALCFSINDLELGFGFLGMGCGGQSGCTQRGQGGPADRYGLQYGGFYDGDCRERSGWDQSGRPIWDSPRNRGGGAYGWDGNWYPQNQGRGGGAYWDCGPGGPCGYVPPYGSSRPRNGRTRYNRYGQPIEEDTYYDGRGYRNEPGWYYDGSGRRTRDPGGDYWSDQYGNSYYQYSCAGSSGCFDGTGYQQSPYWARY